MVDFEQQLRSILHQVILFADYSLGAERALVVYEGYGVIHGLEADSLFTSGEISTSLLAGLMEEGEPMVMIDAAEDERTRDHTSAILSALRSVIYVPVRNPAGNASGFFYADHRRRAGAFNQSQLELSKRYVEETLRPQLAQLGPDAAGANLDFDDLVETTWL